MFCVHLNSRPFSELASQGHNQGASLRFQQAPEEHVQRSLSNIASPETIKVAVKIVQIMQMLPHVDNVSTYDAFMTVAKRLM